MSDHCLECFPESSELARLAENAQAGRSEPFVGRGDPDTVLACVHGSWRLGDAIAEPVRACQATTAAGEPCKGRPGEDGFCAAHKPKGDDGAGDPAAAGDADPPAEEGAEAEAQDGGKEAVSPQAGAGETSG